MTSLEKIANILLISSFLVIPLCVSLEINIITPTQSLRDGDVLVSTQKKFALGFFSPGNSRYRYVGIWYNKVPKQTVVWVANRDNPINDSSGIMSISGQGTLVIYAYNKTGTSLWSANISTTSLAKNSTAKLSDQGNLVLVENGNNTLIWQSFEYPSDSILGGMKIGLNRHSGLHIFPTSWKSKNDPGTGTVSFKVNTTGYPQFFLYKNESPSWRAGHWTGKRWSGVPQMIRNFIFSYSLIDNQDEIYIIINMVNNSIFSRMVINESGLIERTTWHDQIHQWIAFWSAPKEGCENYGWCGPNGYCDSYMSEVFLCMCLPGFVPKSPRDWYLRDGSAGCVRKQGVSTCQNGEGFVLVSRVKTPDTSIARVNKGISLKECEKMCLNNCSCMAYGNADERVNEIVCLMWHGDLVDIRTFTNAGQDLYVRVDAATLAAYAKRSNSSISNKGKVGISIASTIVLLLLLFLAYMLVTAKRKRTAIERQSQYLSKISMNSPYFEDSTGELSFYNLNTITIATNNFSDDNKLGEGGFGSVYKGVLSEGKEIAVKRLSKNSGQGIQEFKNEIMLISKLQHKNLVKILGCCIQENEQMLIYEYVANKSLDTFIYDETKRIMLGWSQRFDIICGVARGMLYLHHDSRLRIIHRDLKASNILLDDTMNPKIADFGMARIFKRDQIEANTKRVVGTYGYMSPEYAMGGLFSIKSDVYSFGVLILEIITGKKNTSYYNHDNPESNLIGHVWDSWKEGKVLDIIDSCLEEEFDNKVLRYIQIGLLCVQEHAFDRPTMSEVVFMLGNDDSTLPSPNVPAFIIRKNYINGDPSTTKGINSINYVTCTTLEAR